MIKYFLNLNKLKEYADKYKNIPGAKTPLIAAIGPDMDKQPAYLLFLDILEVIDGLQVKVVRVIDKKTEELVYIGRNTDHWIEKIKRTAEHYDKKFDDEEDDGKNECTSICDNPDCVEYGNQVDVIKDESGKIICPHCGEEIGAEGESPDEDESYFGDEEDDPYEEVDRERLVEIAYLLIQFALVQSDEEYNQEVMDFLGIDLEDLDAITQEYNMLYCIN